MQREGWQRVVVAASGPSLTVDASVRALQLQCSGYKVIAVNDAWHRCPFADVLYACDRGWWDYHGHAVLSGFRGEKWTSTTRSNRADDDKIAWGKLDLYGLKTVLGIPEEGFSFEPGVIHYGNNSGFQAVGLALQFGAKEIRLAGFDMRKHGARSHFFGEHPPELNVPSNYGAFVDDFKRGAASLPPDRRVVCCTPGSALNCFPFEEL